MLRRGTNVVQRFRLPIPFHTACCFSTFNVPDQMQAITLEYPSDRAQLPVLSQQTVAVPSTGPVEVLVKVNATGINPLDWKMRDGYGREIMSALRGNSPIVLGREAAGVIVECGKDVWSHQVGDAVWVCVDTNKNGTFAEYVNVTANEVSLRPNCLDDRHCAALPFSAITAWRALVETAHLFDPHSPYPTGYNKKVFIHGGSGAVGRFAVQLLRHYGFRVSVSCSDAKRQMMLDMGCEHTVNYKSTSNDFFSGANATRK